MRNICTPIVFLKMLGVYRWDLKKTIEVDRHLAKLWPIQIDNVPNEQSKIFQF